jgi:hypothetical protein
MTEIDVLYPVEGNGRNFDALVGTGRIAGRLAFEMFEHQAKTVVYYDREQPLDSVYAVKRGGTLEDIADDATAAELIIAGIDTTRQ